MSMTMTKHIHRESREGGIGVPQFHVWAPAALAPDPDYFGERTHAGAPLLAASANPITLTKTVPDYPRVLVARIVDADDTMEDVTVTFTFRDQFGAKWVETVTRDNGDGTETLATNRACGTLISASAAVDVNSGAGDEVEIGFGAPLGPPVRLFDAERTLSDRIEVYSFTEDGADAAETYSIPYQTITPANDPDASIIYRLHVRSKVGNNVNPLA